MTNLHSTIIIKIINNHNHNHKKVLKNKKMN